MLSEEEKKAIELEKRDKEILKNLKDYLNLLISEGKDKIIFNKLNYDEKIIDCIGKYNRR